MTGAAFQALKPEITNDSNAYFDRIGLLRYHFELNPLGFYPDNFTGIFREKYVDQLLTFCEKNTAYHIVTQTHPGRYENRYVPGCRTYFLAEGDKNQNLILNLCYEKMLAKASAIIHEINRCDKRK